MTRTFLRLLATICFISTICAAQTGLDLKEATLFSPLGNNLDQTRGFLNFETGEIGVLHSQSLKDFDLAFGTMAINSDNNWFEVRDSRSRITDLGAKDWSDFKETPPFPKAKVKTQPSLNPPKVVDASAGSREISPYNQFIPTKFAHMYLMRVLKSGKVIYIMFRVERLDTQKSCLLSWKKVPPPRVDNENF